MSYDGTEDLEQKLRQREQEISALAEHQQKVINAWIARGDELGRRVSQLQGLLSLGSILFQPMSLERGLRFAVRKLQDCLEAQCAGVYQLKGDQLHLCAQRGWTEEMLRETSVLKFGEGIAGMAAEAREMVVLDDISQEPRHTVLSTRAAGFRSLLGVPIMMGTNVWGVIGIGCRAPGRLGDLEKSITKVVASLLAVAVELDELRRTASEAARVSRSGGAPPVRHASNA